MTNWRSAAWNCLTITLVGAQFPWQKHILLLFGLESMLWEAAANQVDWCCCRLSRVNFCEAFHLPSFLPQDFFPSKPFNPDHNIHQYQNK
jgi:hypothetical protein